MIIKNFIQFLSEDLNINSIDKKSLNKIRENFIIKLREYREYILDNIVYDTKTNKVSLINFEQIEIPIIIRELENEFTKELVSELNIVPFLRKINQILELKRRNTKSKVREEFRDYISSINSRIENSDVPNIDTFDELEGEDSLLGRKKYETEKYNIQVELLKLQEWVINNGKKVAIVFEGRDSAGKGSTIKTFIEYLKPSGFRVVALGVPTEEEKNNWFGRYEKHMPEPGEIVFFDRSWYNRAVVEPSLGYCTEEQYLDFMNGVNKWESDMMNDDVILIKFWFSITKEKQLQRFDIRKNSPLKYWKFSPNDAKVVDKWDVISNYKNQMFNKTSTKRAPWVIISTGDKRIGRLNSMRYVLSEINYDDKNDEYCKWYPEVVNIVS